MQKSEVLRSERHAQVLLVSTLKRKLRDLETKETEEIRQLELEHSLLGGELEAEREQIQKVGHHLIDAIKYF